MSDTPKTEVKAEKSATPMVSLDGLKELLLAMQQNNAEQVRELASTLLEARKPYVDEKQEENLRMIREKDAEFRRQREENIKASQAQCPHLQGSNPLSEYQGHATSIVKHRLDTGELIGICTNCLRVFRAADPDYNYQVNGRKSGNRTSMSGQRYTYVPAPQQPQAFGTQMPSGPAITTA